MRPLVRARVVAEEHVLLCDLVRAKRMLKHLSVQITACGFRSVSKTILNVSGKVEGGLGGGTAV